MLQNPIYTKNIISNTTEQRLLYNVRVEYLGEIVFPIWNSDSQVRQTRLGVQCYLQLVKVALLDNTFVWHDTTRIMGTKNAEKLPLAI